MGTAATIENTTSIRLETKSLSCKITLSQTFRKLCADKVNVVTLKRTLPHQPTFFYFFFLTYPSLLLIYYHSTFFFVLFTNIMGRHLSDNSDSDTGNNKL